MPSAVEQEVMACGFTEKEDLSYMISEQPWVDFTGEVRSPTAHPTVWGRVRRLVLSAAELGVKRESSMGGVLRELHVMMEWWTDRQRK
jgi:hypothetical protein